MAKIVNKGVKNVMLRPYADRNQFILLKPGCSVILDLKKCHREVARIPKVWFGNYGCVVESETGTVKEKKATKKTKKSEKIETPVVKQEEVVAESPKIVEEVTETKMDVVEPKVEGLVEIRVETGVYKFYNKVTKNWQRLREANKCPAGAVVCNSKTTDHYVVDSIGDRVLKCKMITAKEADVLIGAV